MPDLSALRALHAERTPLGVPCLRAAAVRPLLLDPADADTGRDLALPPPPSVLGSGGSHSSSALSPQKATAAAVPQQALSKSDLAALTAAYGGLEVGSTTSSNSGGGPPLSVLHGLEPRMARVAPPLMAVTDAEMIWINPDYTPPLLWEPGLCTDNTKGAEVRERN